MAISAISLFAGVGMLDEGVATALRFYGQTLQTICRVEWELSAAAQLVTLMEKKLIDSAPIWSDVTTFDASEWRGKVDCVIAGFPCQDLSVAGSRAGLDGKKSGLFYEVLRVASDSNAQSLFLENVAGITSATASAIHADYGNISERAAARVVGELADAGWNAEWLHVRADEVGAAHRRERWFCFAWRPMANHQSKRGRLGLGIKQPRRNEVKSPSNELADTNHCRPERSDDNGRETRDQLSLSGDELGCAGLQHSKVQQRHDGAKHQATSSQLGDDQIARLEGRCAGSKLDTQRWADEVGSIAKSSDALFAPSPANAGWGRIIANRPELAPAVEPDFCVVVDGVAANVDASRATRLRATGNGVVPLQAGCAYAELIKRSKRY